MIDASFRVDIPVSVIFKPVKGAGVTVSEGFLEGALLGRVEGDGFSCDGLAVLVTVGESVSGIVGCEVGSSVTGADVVGSLVVGFAVVGSKVVGDGETGADDAGWAVTGAPVGSATGASVTGVLVTVTGASVAAITGASVAVTTGASVTGKLVTGPGVADTIGASVATGSLVTGDATGAVVTATGASVNNCGEPTGAEVVRLVGLGDARNPGDLVGPSCALVPEKSRSTAIQSFSEAIEEIMVKWL